MSTTATSFEFVMPSLGADMEAGRITEWLIAPGDTVTKGQIVAVVETEKADIDIEIFHPGVVEELLVPQGAQVPVGTPIARIGAEGATATGSTADVPPPPPPHPRLLAPEPAPMPAPAPPPVFAPGPAPAAAPVTSPLVRHLAEELHVDLSTVHGSRPGGRLSRDDVVEASHRPPGRPQITPRARRLAEERGIPLDRLPRDRLVTGADVLALVDTAPAPPPTTDPMRRAIATLMARSWAEIPHFHVATRLDLSEPLRRLAELNASRPVTERIIPAAVLLAAVARAAAKVPALNGWWIDDRFEPSPTVDLGVVMSLRTGGLVVPTIAEADGLSLEEMMARLSELTGRARHGRLRGSDMARASITVTSLGDRGIDSLFGVIHPPQVALVGLGSIHEEPWAEAGTLAARTVVHATLAGDHRAVDGLIGASLLSKLPAVLAGVLTRSETS